MKNAAEITSKVYGYFNMHHASEFNKIGNKYIGMGYASTDFIKYFRNVEYWIFTAAEWYVAAFQTNGLSYLDIGCGMGWLAFVVKVMGYSSMLADTPTTGKWGYSSIGYLEGLKALGLERNYEFYVTKNELMPVEGMYDVITATGVAFHCHWSEDDWRFFIADAKSHLKKGGLIFLQVNSDGKIGCGYDSLKNITDEIKAEWQGVKICLIR